MPNYHIALWIPGVQVNRQEICMISRMVLAETLNAQAQKQKRSQLHVMNELSCYWFVGDILINGLVSGAGFSPSNSNAPMSGAEPA